MALAYLGTIREVGEPPPQQEPARAACGKRAAAPVRRAAAIMKAMECLINSSIRSGNVNVKGLITVGRGNNQRVDQLLFAINHDLDIDLPRDPRGQSGQPTNRPVAVAVVSGR